MNDVFDCLAHYRHWLLIASGGLLVLALLLWRAEKRGRMPYVAFSAILLVMFAVIYPFKDDPTIWVPAAIAILGIAAAAIMAWKPESKPEPVQPPADTIEQYEKRLRVLEQLTLQQQAEATPGNEQERLVNEAKVKAVQAKLADVEKSWADEQKLRKEAEDALVQLNGLLPDEQLKKAKESLANGDKEAAEKAFDAVDDKESEAVALAAHQSGTLAEDRLDYEKAMRKYKRAVLLQEENPDYLLAAGIMARMVADYAQAQEWLEKLLKMREAEKKDDADLATPLNELAGLYKDQGCYEEAEPLLKRSLAIREKKLGKDHPDVAKSLNNLAVLYDAQGCYEEAEPLYKRSLAIRESKLEKDHPDVAAALNNLAALYDDQGRYEEAEPLYNRALAIREQKFGKDHPEVATSLNNLALLYHSQGHYAEAESLYKRALAIREQKLGKDHPNVATTLNNLAGLYYSQGRYEEMEPLYNRALAIRESKLGKDHPDVANSLNNLAALYDDQGRYEEAEPLYKRALAIRESKLGKDHPDVANSLNNLANLYYAQGHYAEAEPLLKRSLAILKAKFPGGHPNLDILQANYDELKAKQASQPPPAHESMSKQ